MNEQAQEWVKKKKNNETINDVDSNLTGPLDIESFTNLKSISLKKHTITSLEINQCLQLTKIDLSELTKLTSLSVSGCSELIKLECSHSQLTSLDLSNNNKLVELNCCGNRLIELDVSDCPNLIELDCSYNLIKNLIIGSNITKLNYFDNSPNFDITREKGRKENVRNLLIVGRTGCGKSTLANVLSGSDVFEESGGSVSKTKNFKKRDFEWNGTKYRVVDTIGVGDTELTNNEVLNKIAEGIYLMPEGISQILFVVDGGELIKKEIEMLELFKGIFKYVTIVRTKFVNFKNEGECEKDREKLCEGNEIITKIVSRKGIIYVDNPLTNINNGDDDDERINKLNKKKREESRTKLLDYLKKKCQKNYKSKAWDNLYYKINSYMKETEPESKNLPTIEEKIAKDVEFAFNLEIPLFKVNFIAKAKELNCSLL